MKVVISSFGSSGDFNPCLGLGRALQNKGVDVIFLSNPYYEKKITDAGLRFFPSGEYWDVFNEIGNNPDFLHPRKGPKEVWKLVLKTVPVMYDAMTALIRRESPDMVACHLLEYGGMLAAINQKNPYVVLSPGPVGWNNTKQPGYLTYREYPEWIRRCFAAGLRFMMSIAMRCSLRPYCLKRAIPNPFKNIDDVYTNACLNLGLWSKLLRSPASDDPPNSKICGFVRDKHIKDWPDVPDKIVQLFEGPKPPVVVGLGSTASLHGDEIYQNVVAVCKKLRWPCLLIGKDIERFASQDYNILSINFAPYGWVFPRAGMVIHHGGLNTTAETLRAGVPGLIIPHAYDQFDNAIRTGQMGVSKRLKLRQVTSPIFSLTIQSILNDTQMQERAKALSIQLQAEPDGGDIAAEALMKAM